MVPLPPAPTGEAKLGLPTLQGMVTCGSPGEGAGCGAVGAPPVGCGALFISWGCA